MKKEGVVWITEEDNRDFEFIKLLSDRWDTHEDLFGEPDINDVDKMISVIVNRKPHLKEASERFKAERKDILRDNEATE